jgi:hypothetical protein
MLPILLEEILLQFKRVYKEPELAWTPGTVSEEDLRKLEEATHGTQFDPLHLKKGMWDAYKNGSATLQCVESTIARVVAILPKNHSVPKEWGRIFQSFGAPKYGPKWVIYWFGASAPRRFPEPGLPLSAEHLNGGYTQTCSTNGIFIYRLEEASRVLIHELLHAACQDPVEKSIPQREAVIETWAELIFVAYRAKGSPSAAARLWKLQTQWVADTNKKAAEDNMSRSEDDYGWRYLNGRTEVYQSLGLTLPPPSKKPAQSRFTHPTLGD